MMETWSPTSSDRHTAPLRRCCRARTRPLQRAISAVLLGLLGAQFAGCSSGELLGEVFGRVTFQGEPVTAGSVIFRNPEKGVHIMAKLADDGRYAVEMATGYGLPPGTYQVAVSLPFARQTSVGGVPTRPEPKPEDFANIPLKYRNPETSRLRLTVQKGSNRFDIDMQP